MNLFGLFQVSGSALAAERLRAEVVTSNLVNAQTARNSALAAAAQSSSLSLLDYLGKN